MKARSVQHRILALAVVSALTACAPSPASAPAGESSGPVTIRVGYFPNITHAQALIGLARGDFAQALGARAVIAATEFNAGPSVIEALFAGEIDLAYIGPNPAINGYVQSEGAALRIVAGATSGGAAFVVRPEAGITTAADLSGKTLATPQLGNTQDIALRHYLADHGLSPVEQGGTVSVVPTPNAQILTLFTLGQIDGAWVPEPWASRLVVEGGGVVLVDERELWPNGDFVTAHLIISTPFLEAHPDLVRVWLATHVTLTEWANANPDPAKTLINSEIERLTGRGLPPAVLDQAWGRLRLTWDPIAPSLARSADAAYAAGFLNEEPDLTGIYDLRFLNDVLTERNLETVSDNLTVP